MNEILIKFIDNIALLKYIHIAAKVTGKCYIKQNEYVVNGKSKQAIETLDINKTMLFIFDAFDSKVAEEIKAEFGIEKAFRNSEWYSNLKENLLVG